MATAWQVSLMEDDTLNNSDKLFTVPASTEWQVLWVSVTYTSTATAGTRQLEVQFQSSASNVIAQWQTAVTQDASLTYKYLFGTGLPDLSSLRDGEFIMTPMLAASFLSDGQKVRVWDNNAVDTSGDDMSVKIEYGYHEI